MNKIAEDNLILLTEVGSDLHGVTVNQQDDKDLMGVYIEPPNLVLGLSELPHVITRTHEDGTPIPDGHRSGPGDTDRTLYGLRKFVRLASAGNPTVLMPLFAPADKTYHAVGAGQLLQLLAPGFVTKQAGLKFLGYCRGQYAQMIDLKGKHTNRPELIEQYGFDTKFAYHALRLAIQGRELMTTCHVTLPLNDELAGYIKDVRVGKYTKEQVTTQLDAEIGALERAVDGFDGPDRMDREALDGFLRNMYLSWWEEKGLI